MAATLSTRTEARLVLTPARQGGAAMRMYQLDTLRAFALGSVMVEHYGGQWINQHFPIGAGSSGVGCFFTLSGFLITGILLQSFDAAEKTSVAFGTFYMRRFLRLMPAFYAVILALVLLGIQPIVNTWPWHAAYLTNVWMAFGHPSNVFWSLAVEEQFYLLWPLAIVVTPRRWLPAATIGLMLLSLLFKVVIYRSGISLTDAHGLLPVNFDLLAVGCLLAMLCYRNGRSNNFDWYTGPVVVIFTVVAWACMGLAVASWYKWGDGSILRFFTNNLLCGVFFAWLVLNAAVGFKGWVGAIFNLKPLQYVGQISYGLYLVHNWMPKIVEKYAGTMPRIPFGIVCLTATFAVCILSWHFLEKPILNLRHRYAERRVVTA
jgi:peptidoglycan/LPS O-acetylase OafA/YrhL